eukprot:351336-Chlamydomonas_euryale.AAC.4
MRCPLPPWARQFLQAIGSPPRDKPARSNSKLFKHSFDTSVCKGASSVCKGASSVCKGASSVCKGASSVCKGVSSVCEGTVQTHNFLTRWRACPCGRAAKEEARTLRMTLALGPSAGAMAAAGIASLRMSTPLHTRGGAAAAPGSAQYLRPGGGGGDGGLYASPGRGGAAAASPTVHAAAGGWPDMGAAGAALSGSWLAGGAMAGAVLRGADEAPRSPEVQRLAALSAQVRVPGVEVCGHCYPYLDLPAGLASHVHTSITPLNLQPPTPHPLAFRLRSTSPARGRSCSKPHRPYS